MQVVENVQCKPFVSGYLDKRQIKERRKYLGDFAKKKLEK